MTDLIFSSLIACAERVVKCFSFRKFSSQLPASTWFRHGDGSNTGTSRHGGDELGHLLLAAVVGDVRHDDVGMEGKPAAGEWPVRPVKKMLSFSRLTHSTNLYCGVIGHECK